MMFWKLDLFLSSGEGGRHLLMVSPLERANLDHWTTPVKSSLMLRPTVSQPVCLGKKHPSELKIRFLLLSDSCGFVDVGRSL
jgi:hypothetical protein